MRTKGTFSLFKPIVVCVFFFFLAFINGTTHARAAKNYIGPMDVTLTNCVDPDGDPAEPDDNFTLSGIVTIVDNTGDLFDADGKFFIFRYFMLCGAGLEYDGKGLSTGNLTGSYTHFFKCINDFTSNGSGTFTGSIDNDHLTLQVHGKDTDVTGVTCTMDAIFIGEPR